MDDADGEMYGWMDRGRDGGMCVGEGERLIMSSAGGSKC